MSDERDKKQKTSKSRRETAVQGTNDSSIVSKCSMAHQGYFDDPFLKNFVIKVTRRAPLIHRGYYIRAKILDTLEKKFLQSNTGRKQIISLGAGFDSAYFRLTSQALLKDTVYCEVDFPEVVKRKHALIKMNDVLSGMIGEEVQGKDKCSPIELCCKNYKLVGVDLSQVNTLEAALRLCDVDFDVPTMLISEVVLTYMSHRSSSIVIKWAAETFTDSIFVMYEQINPDDAFGLFMQKHFKTIGSPLKCINTYPTMQSQIDRFTKLGWDYCEAVDVNRMYSDIVIGAERDRVESLEPFDEYEEFHLKCSHYMTLCAYKGDNQLHLLSHIKSPVENVTDDPEVRTHNNCIKLTHRKTANQFCRFGHVTTCLGADWMMSVGGFGEQDGKHMRVTDVTLLSKTTLELVSISPKTNNREMEVSRMHATASCLQDGTILLIGGRLSPMKLCTQMVALRWNCGKSELYHLLNSFKTSASDVPAKIVTNADNSKHKQNKKRESLKTNFESESDKTLENCDCDTRQANCDNWNDAQEKLVENDKGRDLEAVNTSNSGSNMEMKCVDSVSCDKTDRDEVQKLIKERTDYCDVVDGQFDNHTASIPNAGCHSDKEAMNDSNLNRADNLGDLLDCCVIQQEGEIPSPRWRHSTVTAEQNGQERIILFGGRTQDKLALADCYSFDVRDHVWTKVHCSGELPSPRHSHTASLWNNHMIIAGGLGEDLQPLNSVHMLNLETNTWIKLSCKMPARYSHTSCIIKDFLVLIGGVNFCHRVPGVTLIDLTNKKCADFSLPVADKDNLLMLHGHKSVAIDNNRILLFGGGGNCFSFGTHLNSSPIIMDLTEAFQMMEHDLE